MQLHGTSRINERGHLEIGGCDTIDLVQTYGTPLYVIDEKLIRERMKAFRQAFSETGLAYQTAYASKAFSTMAMCRLVDQEDFLLDVVSSGELHTALQADFPPERIYFHGNNKSPEELTMALEAKIGLFVVDNFYELTLLSALAQEREQKTAVMLRITPGVEAQTHSYIQTGQIDSKFGFDVLSQQALKAAERVEADPFLSLEGFHVHIGSQITELDSIGSTVEKMADFVATCYRERGIVARKVNLGGGFGIHYHAGQKTHTPAAYVSKIEGAVRTYFDFLPQLPEIWIEPGRYIVGEAGTTLYTLGSRKEIPGVRTYMAVDGGMTDNPRPALYQAKHEALLANRANEPVTETVSIAGKCCESGDMLIWDLALPQAKEGDILAVSSTGAYNYSMASNYNRLPRPAVVFVSDGKASLVVQRESLDDLISHDRIPEHLQSSLVCG